MFSIVFKEATTGPFLSQLNPLHLIFCFLNTLSPISPVHPIVLISWIAFQLHQNNLLKSCTIWDKMFLIQSILAWNTLTVLHKNNGNIYWWRYVLVPYTTTLVTMAASWTDMSTTLKCASTSIPASGCLLCTWQHIRSLSTRTASSLCQWTWPTWTRMTNSFTFVISTAEGSSTFLQNENR